MKRIADIGAFPTLIGDCATVVVECLHVLPLLSGSCTAPFGFWEFVVGVWVWKAMLRVIMVYINSDSAKEPELMPGSVFTIENSPVSKRCRGTPLPRPPLL